MNEINKYGAIPKILRSMDIGATIQFKNYMEDRVRQAVRRENFKLKTADFRENTWKLSIKGGELTVTKMY